MRNRWTPIVHFCTKRLTTVTKCRAGHTTIFQLRDNAMELQKQAKIRQMRRLRWLNGATTTNIDIIHNQQFFGLKTWSRCRGSVVACPALIKSKFKKLNLVFSMILTICDKSVYFADSGSECSTVQLYNEFWREAETCRQSRR